MSWPQLWQTSLSLHKQQLHGKPAVKQDNITI
jgi:hypothetical protein